MAVDDEARKQGDAIPAAPPGTGPQSEWTASDRRGPLTSADHDDVERVVPAHEIDAEGGVDRPAPSDEVSGTEAEAPPTQSPLPSEPVAATARGDIPNEPRRSMLPVAAGLVIGAVIGAGSAWIVYAQGSGPGNDQDKRLAAVSTRVDALEKRPGPGAAIDQLKSDVAALQGKVEALGKPDGDNARDDALAAKVTAIQATLAALQSQPRAPAAGDGGAASAVAALQKDVAAARKQAADAATAAAAGQAEQQQLRAKVTALSSQVDGTAAKVDGADKEAAKTRTTLEAVQDRQTTLEGKLGSPALAVVADSLVEQVRAGQPFTRQVDALAALGADPAKVALLRERAGGVASAPTLLADWKALEAPVVATGNRAPADAGFGARLEHGLFGLVSVRRADGTVGNDLAARVSSIENDLGRGDVSAASSAWQALPPDAKARSTAFGEKVASSAEALNIAHGLQHAAIDAMGGKKS